MYICICIYTYIHILQVASRAAMPPAAQPNKAVMSQPAPAAMKQTFLAQLRNDGGKDDPEVSIYVYVYVYMYVCVCMCTFSKHSWHSCGMMAAESIPR